MYLSGDLGIERARVELSSRTIQFRYGELAGHRLQGIQHRSCLEGGGTFGEPEENSEDYRRGPWPFQRRRG
jgi:hypothetical protein